MRRSNSLDLGRMGGVPWAPLLTPFRDMSAITTDAGAAKTDQAKFSLLTPDFIIHPSNQTLSSSLTNPNAPTKPLRSPRTSIFSIDIHPHNNRVVTGGNDHYVRLWSLQSVIDTTAFHDPNHHNELFAAKRHDGGVMCVRWACSDGTLLASGADDGSLVIWRLNTAPCTIPGLLVGAKDPVTYPESLTFLKKLPSMASDVIDLAWSFNNRHLATCSLDNTVIVFDGLTFDCIARCQHSSFVKGLAFDPVGTYLVSQSDDGSAVFWNTTTWKQDVKVHHAFIQDTGSAAVFVRRPSFSPDGSFVACANAVSNGVHVAALFPRNRWTYPTKTIYLVGHTAPVCVAKFAPILVSSSPGYRPSPILALGSNDRRISLWVLCAHPVLILDSVFESDVTDISWSRDGRTLLASSHEGKVAGIHVGSDLDLFGGGHAVAQSVIDAQLDKYDRSPSMGSVVDQSLIFHTPTTGLLPKLNSVAAAEMTPLTTQRVSTTKDGRKRIQPALVTTFHSPDLSFSTSNLNDFTRNGHANRLPESPLSQESGPARLQQSYQGPEVPRDNDDLSRTSSRLSMDASATLQNNNSHLTQHPYILNPLPTNPSSETLILGKENIQLHITNREVPVKLSVYAMPTSSPILTHLVLDSPAHACYIERGHVALITCLGTFMVLDLWLKRVVVRHSFVYLLQSLDSGGVSLGQDRTALMPTIDIAGLCYKYDQALDCFVFLG